jgi:hypothetical protein
VLKQSIAKRHANDDSRRTRKLKQCWLGIIVDEGHVTHRVGFFAVHNNFLARAQKT